MGEYDGKDKRDEGDATEDVSEEESGPATHDSGAAVRAAAPCAGCKLTKNWRRITSKGKQGENEGGGYSGSIVEEVNGSRCWRTGMVGDGNLRHVMASLSTCPNKVPYPGPQRFDKQRGACTCGQVPSRYVPGRLLGRAGSWM
jgi:hypothetical protein